MELIYVATVTDVDILLYGINLRNNCNIFRLDFVWYFIYEQ